MSEAIQLWLFGGFTAWMAFVTAMWQLHAIKLARIELTLKVFLKGAAKIMHSPHTPQLDALLEAYMSQNGELTLAQWAEVQKLCQEIVDDSNDRDERRTLAAFWVAMSDHKQNNP